MALGTNSSAVRDILYGSEQDCRYFSGRCASRNTKTQHNSDLRSNADIITLEGRHKSTARNRSESRIDSGESRSVKGLQEVMPYYIIPFIASAIGIGLATLQRVFL